MNGGDHISDDIEPKTIDVPDVKAAKLYNHTHKGG